MQTRRKRVIVGWMSNVRAKRADTEATTRLYAIVARDARKAVVFRRGPAGHVRMLSWDLSTDEVTGGQWLAGRVSEEKCDLSPNGELVVYRAAKRLTKVGTFTAISRPPYFTALALWPDAERGGGFFETNRRVVLWYGRVDFELHAFEHVPKDFEVIAYTEHGRRKNQAFGAEASQGWTYTKQGVDGKPTKTMRVVFDQPWIREKSSPVDGGTRLERLWTGMFELNGPRCVYQYRLVQSKGTPRRDTATIDLGRIDWADWDHEGSLLCSAGGRLYRRDVSNAFTRPLPRARLVADLSKQTFSNIRPTAESKTWPTAR